MKMRLLAAVICLAALAVGTWLYTGRTYNVRLDIHETSNLREVREAWQPVFHSLKPHAAYAIFKQYYTDHPQNAHAAAHTIGDILFQQMGVNGLTVCDNSFGSGCYHELMGLALMQRGVAVLPDLTAQCETIAPTAGNACTHGIGHGVMAYYGNADITAVINACEADRVLSENAVVECMRGALMEYYMPSNIDDGTMNVLAHRIDMRHPYDMCPERIIPDQYKHVCYSALPTWWARQALLSTREIAALCDRLDAASRTECYRGLGFNIPGTLQYDEIRIIDECKTIRRADGTRLCLRYSADTLKSLQLERCKLQKELGEECTE